MSEQLRMAIPVLWPAMAVAGAIMLMAWWPRRSKPGETAPVPGVMGWASALALGLAFLAAFMRIVNGTPVIPPPEKWQWLLPIAGAGTACGLVAGIVERFAPARWFIALCSAALVGYAFHPIGSIEQPWLWRIGVAIDAFIIWMCLEGSARRHRGFATPLLLSLIFAGVSIVILQGRNANISLLAASTSAALGVIALLALLLPPLSLAGGATYVLSGLLAGFVAVAWMYGIGAPIALCILAATPLVLRGGEALFRRAAGWKLFMLRLLCTAILVAAAVTIAMIDAAKAADQYTP